VERHNPTLRDWAALKVEISHAKIVDIFAALKQNLPQAEPQRYTRTSGKAGA